MFERRAAFRCEVIIDPTAASSFRSGFSRESFAITFFNQLVQNKIKHTIGYGFASGFLDVLFASYSVGIVFKPQDG